MIITMLQLEDSLYSVPFYYSPLLLEAVTAYRLHVMKGCRSSCPSESTLEVGKLLFHADDGEMSFLMLFCCNNQTFRG